MDELKNEQTAVNAGAPVDETAKDIAASLGKFKDVNALLAAYNSLQAEFTKRCQRIKELERSAAVDKDTPTEQSEKADNRNLSITEEEKQDFIKGYLKEIIGAKSKAIVMDGLGAGIKTPANKPKTVEEAGVLFKNMLAK
nr:hypothetical protein [Clostridia bacterium]